MCTVHTIYTHLCTALLPLFIYVVTLIEAVADDISLCEMTHTVFTWGIVPSRILKYDVCVCVVTSAAHAGVKKIITEAS